MKDEKIESDYEHLGAHHHFQYGRCNQVRGSDYDIREDDKVSMYQLQKGHLTRKRLQDVFEKWYSYEKTAGY